MPNGQRGLHFRRHLAVLALLLLLNELHLGGARVRPASAAAAAEQQQQQHQHHHHHHHDEQLGVWARLADLLPEINLNYTLLAGRSFDSGQLDEEVERYYGEQFGQNATLEQLQLMAVKAALRLAPMPMHTSWGYESRSELRLGSLPVQDDRQCAGELGRLAARLGPKHADGPAPGATDLPFLRYLDTFGRVPSDLLRGNTRWYGSRAGCLDTRLERARFRYCMVALKSVGWSSVRTEHERSKWADYGVHSSDANLDNYFIRIGVCMPESCDSSALEQAENAAAIERLLKFNLAAPFNSDRYFISDLYCPPDQRSPLRRLPLAGKLLLLAAFGWLALVGAATLVHLNVERFYRKAAGRIRRGQSPSALSNGRQADSGQWKRKRNQFEERDILQIKHNWLRLNVYVMDRSASVIDGVDLIACFSLYSNWLKYTNRLKLACARQHELERRRERMQRRARTLLAETPGSERPEVEWDEEEAAAAEGERLGQRRVDTASLNALKVIALVWIIAGHCVFYLGSIISNGAILKNYVRDLPAFALANGAMYITELFFVVTGCLNAYLLFKYNTAYDTQEGACHAGDEALQMATSGPTGGQGPLPAAPGEACRVRMKARLFEPPFWLMVTLHRYLRIAPTYLAVYAFVRLVSVYTSGEGQLWDYAVSVNSMRRRCTQESWLPVLALSTNLVDIYQHCIVGGWYLSVDMQFMLAGVPLLLLLAHCQRARPGSRQVLVGRRLLLGYALLFLTGLLSALASIVHGIRQSQVDLSYILKFVPHTVAVLSRNIAMYTNSLFRLRAFALGLILGHLLYLYESRLIRLPKFVQQHGAKLASAIFVLGFCTMFLPVLYPKGKIVLSHDVITILMVLSAGGIDLFLCSLIFLICVGKAPKPLLFALNSPFWSLLSSLSLCAFLVHTEVIIVLTSQLNPPPAVQYSLLLFVFSATLILTYLLALALYLSFEMPVSRLVEALLTRCSSHSARSSRQMLHRSVRAVYRANERGQ